MSEILLEASKYRLNINVFISGPSMQTHKGYWWSGCQAAARVSQSVGHSLGYQDWQSRVLPSSICPLPSAVGKQKGQSLPSPIAVTMELGHGQDWKMSWQIKTRPASQISGSGACPEPLHQQLPLLLHDQNEAEARNCFILKNLLAKNSDKCRVNHVEEIIKNSN